MNGRAQWLSYAWGGEGVPPSGMDWLAQEAGGMLAVSAASGLVESLDWPWPEWGVSWVHTGGGQATHAQLNTLDASEPWLQDMARWAAEGRAAWCAGKWGGLDRSSEGSAQILAAAGCVAEHTQAMLTVLRDCPEVLAAKGCGAMGADVVLMFHRRSDESAIRAICEALVPRRFRVNTRQDIVPAGLCVEAEA